MNLQDIQDLYPSASFQNEASQDASSISLPLDQGFLTLTKSELSQREVKLLSFLYPQSTFLPITQHFGYSVLFDHGKIAISGDYRTIQISIRNKLFPLKAAWQREIKLLFPHYFDFFFLDENTALLIEKEEETSFNLAEIEGLFLALDADFDIVTQLYVGNFYPNTCDFTILFAEEQAIFNTCVLSRKCLDICQTALLYYSTKNITESQILAQLFTSCLLNSEMRKIIPILWKNLGNLSSTAKDLFMHRNTILYKIDKFYSETKFNLKESDPLFLCHLLIITFAPY